jgi:acetolactate synthase-1/2/3 large subunit
MIKVSDYVIKFLESKNVTHIFTVSGGGCIHLIEGLRKSVKIKTVCVHHEQSATMAAEGYTRLKKTIGVSIVTTGPGGINALNGVFGCWTDSIPSLIFSGQVSLNQTIRDTKVRQYGDQEYSIVDSAKTMTKYAVMITDKNQIRYQLEKSYYEATSGRPGPVWIDIPLDIQGATVDENTLDGYIPEVKDDDFDDELLNKIVKLLEQSKKPLIVVGNGIKVSNSEDKLFNFLNKTKMPIMSNCHSAIDIVNESYEYYCGRHGILGQRSSNKIIQECDLLLVLGSRLTLKTTGYDVNKFAKNAKKIIVDIDLNEINKHKFKIDYILNNDLNIFFDKINSKDINLNISEWQSYCVDLRKSDAFVFKKHYELKDITSIYVFIEKLSKLLPENCPIVTSNGAAHVITQQSIRLKEKQKLFTNVGCASMGYGLPASLGACLANNSSVICIEGDGSIMMNIQELQTVKHYNLPIKIFIINNDGYISIKQTQNTFFDRQYHASNKESGVSFPSFKKVAYAFDIPYVSIKNNDEINDGILNVLNIDGPVICEIISHSEEYFEPKVVSRGIDQNGKIIPGELTDMFISETF